MGIYLQAFGVWIGLAFLAIVNGTIRVKGYRPYVGETVGHVISTATAILLFGAAIYLFFRFTRQPYDGRDAVLIGLLFLALAVAFEFLFGHYVAGHSWARLFHDYRLDRGRLWIVVLLVLAVAPYVSAKFLRRA